MFLDDFQIRFVQHVSVLVNFMCGLRCSRFSLDKTSPPFVRASRALIISSALLHVYVLLLVNVKLCVVARWRLLAFITVAACDAFVAVMFANKLCGTQLRNMK